MTIADISQLHVDVLVDETEIANVQVGQAGGSYTGCVDGHHVDGQSGLHRSFRVGEQRCGQLQCARQPRSDDAPLLLDMTANASLDRRKA